MFDIGIGFSELMLLAVILIIVVGPEELPSLLRTIGRYVGQVKRVADDFRAQVDEAIKETDIDKISDPLNDLKDDVSLDENDPFGEDLIDFEEHNKKVLEKEQKDKAAANGATEEEVPEFETPTEKALRESGVAGLSAVPVADNQSKPENEEFADAGALEQVDMAPEAVAANKSGT